METRNDFRVGGILTGPPSCLDLPVAGVRVTATVLGGGPVFQAETDGQGRFELTGVPGGVLWLQIQAEHGGLFYYGDEMVGVDRDLSLTVVMSNPAVELAASLPETAAELPGELLPEQPPPGVQASAGLQEIAVRIQSKEKGVVLQEARAFEVAQEIKTVELKYTVASMEYKEWVDKASPYNDAWSISVFASQGQQATKIYQICKQVNEMSSGGPDEPVWMKAEKGGVTKELKKDIPLPPVSGDTPWTVTLVAKAVNIEDARFPTAVKASLRPVAPTQLQLTIGNIEAMPVDDPYEPGDYPGYPIDWGVDSLPSPNQLNHYERWFEVPITKPAGTWVSRVRVDIQARDAQLVLAVLDEALAQNQNTESVELYETPTSANPQSLYIRVSRHRSFEFTGAPNPFRPPFSRFVFRFRVTITDGVSEGEATRDSGERTALWRMPALFADRRYSVRETGEDDWCSRAAYDWLEAHEGLISRINDISGEHGINIGHGFRGHRNGTRIDLFHYYGGLVAASGGDYYGLLQQQVATALRDREDQVSRQHLASWIRDTRTAFNNLLAAMTDPRALIFYALGRAFTYRDASGEHTVGEGWAEALLTTGSIDGLDLDVGRWQNQRVRYNNVHNDHVHLQLEFPVSP